MAEHDPQSVAAAAPPEFSAVGEAAAWVAVVFMAAIGLIIVIKLITPPDKGGFPLQRLISEEDGKASLSRFQLLVFTFVIASGVLIAILHTGMFPEISTDVFALLGVSAGSYLGAKITQRVTPSRNGGRGGGQGDGGRTGGAPDGGTGGDGNGPEPPARAPA